MTVSRSWQLNFPEMYAFTHKQFHQVKPVREFVAQERSNAPANYTQTSSSLRWQTRIPGISFGAVRCRIYVPDRKFFHTFESTKWRMLTPGEEQYFCFQHLTERPWSLLWRWNVTCHIHS